MFIEKWVNRSFPLFWWAMWAIRSRLLISSERCEQIAQVAHKKWAMWAIVSKSLRLLTKMSEGVNQSFFWANRSCAHFWEKNEQFTRKTNEQPWSPESDSVVVRVTDYDLQGHEFNPHLWHFYLITTQLRIDWYISTKYVWRIFCYYSSRITILYIQSWDLLL